jgi:hypothetical protein
MVKGGTFSMGFTESVFFPESMATSAPPTHGAKNMVFSIA